MRDGDGPPYVAGWELRHTGPAGADLLALRRSRNLTRRITVIGANTCTDGGARELSGERHGHWAALGCIRSSGNSARCRLHVQLLRRSPDDYVDFHAAARAWRQQHHPRDCA